MAWVVQWYWRNREKNEPPASRCKLALVVFNPGPVAAASERCFRPYISVSASRRGEKVVPFCCPLLALRTVINKSPTCEGQTHIPCSASVISCKLSCYKKKYPKRLASVKWNVIILLSLTGTWFGYFFFASTSAMCRTARKCPIRRRRRWRFDEELTAMLFNRMATGNDGSGDDERLGHQLWHIF